MKYVLHRCATGIVVVSLAVGGSAVAAPAYARTSGASGLDVLAVLEKHGVDVESSYPADLQEVHITSQRLATATAEDVGEAIEEVVYTSAVDLPETADGAITVESQSGSIALSLPDAGDGERQTLTARASSYSHGDGSTSVPVVRDNGVQVLTIVDGPSAPEKYEYEVDLKGGRMEVVESGGVLVYSAQGEVVGAFDAP